MQGSRPERVGEQIRQELSVLIARAVHDPGVGLVTITYVKMSPDLQMARVFYTLIGDAKARKETERALERAAPFLRRQLGGLLRLRRVPELKFQFDESIERQDRIERILLDLEAERRARATAEGGDAAPSADATGDPEAAVDPDAEQPGPPRGEDPS
jgi:ribosome-binding factor A